MQRQKNADRSPGGNAESPCHGGVPRKEVIAQSIGPEVVLESISRGLEAPVSRGIFKSHQKPAQVAKGDSDCLSYTADAADEDELVYSDGWLAGINVY